MNVKRDTKRILIIAKGRKSSIFFCSRAIESGAIPNERITRILRFVVIVRSCSFGLLPRHRFAIGEASPLHIVQCFFEMPRRHLIADARRSSISFCAACSISAESFLSFFQIVSCTLLEYDLLLGTTIRRSSACSNYGGAVLSR